MLRLPVQAVCGFVHHQNNLVVQALCVHEVRESGHASKFGSALSRASLRHALPALSLSRADPTRRATEEQRINWAHARW